MKVTRILTELDVLLDTRLPIYKRLGDESLNTAMVNGYTIRESEGQGVISEEEFHKQYKDRDKSFLMDTDVTVAMQFLNDLILEASMTASQSIEPFKLELLINTFPYILDDNEIAIIKDNLCRYIDSDIEVKIVNKTYKELNYDYFSSEQIETIILYDFLEYFNRVHDDLEEKKLLKPTIKVKAYSCLLTLENKELDIKKIDTYTLEDTVTFLMFTFMDLEYIPSTIFSIEIINHSTISSGDSSE